MSFRKCQPHPVPKLSEALYQQLREQFGHIPEKRRLPLMIGTMVVWFVPGHVYFAQEDEGEIKLLLELDCAEAYMLYPGQSWDKEGNIIRRE